MKTRNALLTLTWGAAVAVSIAGCGGQEPSIPNVSADARAQKSWDDTMQPSLGFYDQALATHMNAMDNGVSVKAAPTTVFINFGGALLHRGKDDGYLSCSESTMVPQSDIPIDQQDALVAQVEGWLTTAGARVRVTTTKPTSGNVATIYIGTTWGDFGCPGEARAARVFSDVGNIHPNDHAIVFADMIPDSERLTVAVAHVAGHMLGAMHTKDPRDIMSFELGNGSAGFSGGIKTDAAFGSPANLPGMTQLVTIGNLLKDMAASQKVVDLARVQAEIQLIMPGRADLRGLERVMTVIKLAEAAAAGKNNGALPDGTANGVSAALMIAAVLNPQIVPVVAGVDALAKIAGYQNGSDALVAVVNMALGQAGIGATVKPLNSLPDLATILGLQNLASMEDLVRTMNAQAEYVNKVFVGEDKQAMLALLKIAYAQAYNLTIRPGLTEW